VNALDSALETVTTAATTPSSSGSSSSGSGVSATNTSAAAARANNDSEAQSSSSSNSNSNSGEGGGGGASTTTTSPVGGCVLVSGFLMDVDTWGKRLATHHRDLRVLQLHGERGGGEGCVREEMVE